MIPDSTRDIILDQNNSNKSYRYLAKLLNLSPNTVRNVVLGLKKTKKRKTGPKRKLNSRHILAIKREFAALESEGRRITADKIKLNCELNDISTRTVRRTLKELNMTYRAAAREIVLKTENKKARLEKARFWINCLWPWHKVVWSDEKRFSLDGPDSWMSWMREANPVRRNNRQQGGGQLQIWGMILPDGRVFYRELHQHSKATDYIQLLEEFVKPTIETEFGEDYIFQQDNASIHTAAKVIKWMNDNNFPVMDWISRSPDCNPIENVWALLTSLVYDRKQFKNVNELRLALAEAVAKLNTEFRYKVMSIRDSIQSRLLQVIEKKGDTIPY